MAKDTRQRHRGGLDAWVPGWASLRGIPAAALPGEVAAGLSIAAVAIPIALAYAALTGVPLQVGLYASIFPMVAYALFGPSRYLIVGPDTATCLLVGSALTTLGLHNPQERAGAASALALIAGVGFGLAAVARLGFIANLLSRPILVGYLTGVAVTLLASQISSFTGVHIQAEGLFKPILEIAQRSAEIHWLTLGLGVGLFVLLRVLKTATPHLPAPAIVVAGAIVLSWGLDLQSHGVEVIGRIPSGLPLPHFPPVNGKIASLGLSALGVLFVSFASGILTARSFGERVGVHSNPNLELRGFAAANILAGLFQGFAVTGADSRTAVNLAAGGGRTPVAPIAAAAVLIIVVTVLTAPLTLLPQAALGAVLASAALGLVDLSAFRRLARLDWNELVFALVAMGGVIWVGVLHGVFLAIAVTLIHLLQLAAVPRHVKLGTLPGQPALYSLDRHPDAKPPENGVAFRFEASLLFINAEHFRDCAEAALESTPGAQWFLLDAASIPYANSSAMEVLRTFKDSLEARGVVLIIAAARGRFRQAIERSGLGRNLGPDTLQADLTSVAAAVRAASSPDGD